MADLQHPNRDLEDLAEDVREKFLNAELERDYFEAWMTWFGHLFGADPSPDRIGATFLSLQRHGFTNVEMRKATRAIEETGQRFPVVSDFLSCPDLARNQGRPQPRR